MSDLLTKDSSKDTSTCDTCHHKDACSAWIRHCTALYDDFSYSTEKCPYYLLNADVVSRSALEQIKWERDIAMEQLAGSSIPFGGKADVTTAVRCAQCMPYEEPWCMLCKTRIGAGYHSRDMAYRQPDDFCSYGKQKGGFLNAD